jgi:thymidylate synthase (FAD)
MGDDLDIVRAARVSTGKGSKGLAADKKLLHYLYKNHHMSPFEMVEIKFHIRVPLFVERQIDRHRTFSTNRESGRYKYLAHDVYFPPVLRGEGTINRQGSGDPLSNEASEDIRGTWRRLVTDVKDAYWFFQHRGLSREQARVITPLAQMSESYWKGNLRNLFHFLELRLHESAQEEIRDFAQAVADIIKALVPLSYECFVKYTLDADVVDAEEKEFLLGMLDYYHKSVEGEVAFPLMNRVRNRWKTKGDN